MQSLLNTRKIFLQSRKFIAQQNKFTLKNQFNQQKFFQKQAQTFFPRFNFSSNISFDQSNLEGMRINKENMEYFNIDMDIFEQNKKYENPEEARNKKLFKDIEYTQNMTLAELCDTIEADPELFYRSAKLIGIKPEDQAELKFEECEILCYEYNCKLVPRNFKQLERIPRPPVVTIMGHVDHGKTTLLDTLRESNVVDGEFGGITQKIGAFHSISADGQRVTYIDTPGHEAFVNMRLRGAASTDMIVLVVSAIEGIQPQTLEVISIAQSNNLPIIVVVNKIDVDGANPAVVEEQLYEKGGLNLETHGGNIPVLHISAKKNINIDFLKELILFETELLELEEPVKMQAEGLVLESRKCGDTQQQSSTIIIQRGTLKNGDWLIIGDEYQKVRQMKDDKNQVIKEAYPSYALEITGLKNSPPSGEVCFTVESETKAKLICSRRKWIKKQKEGQIKQISASASKIKFQTRRERRKFHSGNKELVQRKFNEIEENLMAQIQFLEEIQEERELSQFEMDELIRLNVDLETHREYVQHMVKQDEKNDQAINILLKAVDQGTKETLVGQIYQLVSKFPEIEFNLINSGVGAITENDIREASFANANIIAMDVNAQPDAVKLAKQEGIQISSHRIIYTIMDDIKKMIQQAHSQDKVQLVNMGQGIVKNIFKVKAGKGKSSQRFVAGMQIQKGDFNKKYVYAVKRDGYVVGEQLEIANLKHFKNEVNEIRKGEECGVIFFDFNDLQPGDIVEAYEVQDYEADIF